MRLGSIGGDDLFRPPFFPIGDQHDAPESGLREVVESGLVKGVGQAQVRILSRQLGPEHPREELAAAQADFHVSDRKSTRLNSSHGYISYAVFCLKKKNETDLSHRPCRHSTV